MAQYHLARDGAQLGTFAEGEVVSGLAAGRFLPDDLLWTEGMTDWQPVRTRFQAPVFSGSSPAVVGAGPYNPYSAPLANVAPPVAAGHLQLASLGKRFGAAMLDSLAAFVLIGIPYFLLIFEMERNGDFANDSGLSPLALGSIGVMGIGSLALLTINLVMLTTRGQSIGKRMVGIRIVSHPDGQKPGFVKAVLLRGFVNGLISGIPCIGPVYALVDICFIFQEDRRCLHDQIASTQVVEGHPPA